MFNTATHNGIITIFNRKTGGHRTFKIATIKNGNLKGKRVVSLLIGPDNTSDYLGLGFVHNDGVVRAWNKHKGTVYEKTLEVLNHLDKLNVEVMFEGKCRICNRVLTNPKSLAIGIGSECLNKL